MNMSGANSTIGISKVILQYKVSGRYSVSDADVLVDHKNYQNFIEADCYGSTLVVCSRYRNSGGIDSVVRKIAEECGMYFEEYSV
mgnify:CR=1 FL=1